MIEYLPVEPGIWTQSDDQFTRVLRLKLSATIDVSGYEFSAPDDWDWVANEPSVGAWYSLVKAVQASPMTPRSTSMVSEGGCMSSGGRTKLGFGASILLLILSVPVRRLKSKYGVAAPGFKAADRGGIGLL